MQQAQELSLQEVRESGLEESLKEEVLTVSPGWFRTLSHSAVGVAELKLKSGKIREVFYKRHISIPSETSGSTDPLEVLNSRESVMLNIIYNNINQNLVPRYLGSLGRREEQQFLIITDRLNGKSAQDLLLEVDARKRRAQNDEERAVLDKEQLSLLQEGFRHIAKFNGYCRAYRGQLFSGLHEFIGGANEAFEQKSALREMRLRRYLLRIIHFKEMGGREHQENDGQAGELFDEEVVLSYVQQSRGIDVRESLHGICEAERKLFPKAGHIRLQHGDCRIQHDYSGRFCDLEDFGYYTWVHDLVAYTSERVAAPPLQEVPNLLALYYLHEQAYGATKPGEDNRKPRKGGGNSRKIRMLEGSDPSQALQHFSQLKGVTKKDFADFVAGYLAGVLVDNDLIIDGVRKKHSRQLLHEMEPGISFEEIHQQSPRHIQEIYGFLSSGQAGMVLGNCTERKAVADYFFRLGDLLSERLRLVEIPGLDNLDRLRSASQWDYFG